MSVFRYDEKTEAFITEIDGIRFQCDEVEDGYEDEAKSIANAYRERLPELVSYMLPELCGVYGELSAQQVMDALGVPRIDLNTKVVSYLEHTLDDCHIIIVEFSGMLEKFYEVVIDG